MCRLLILLVDTLLHAMCPMNLGNTCQPSAAKQSLLPSKSVIGCCAVGICQSILPSLRCLCDTLMLSHHCTCCLLMQAQIVVKNRRLQSLRAAVLQLHGSVRALQADNITAYNRVQCLSSRDRQWRHDLADLQQQLADSQSREEKLADQIALKDQELVCRNEDLARANDEIQALHRQLQASCLTRRSTTLSCTS